MAKSKNASRHNQSYKDHRNRIKKIRWNKYTSNNCVNQKLLRNTRRAKKFDPKVIKEKNLTKRIQILRQNKAAVLAAIHQKKAKVAPTAKPTAQKQTAPAKPAPADKKK